MEEQHPDWKQSLHDSASHHRSEVEAAQQCGCFYCLNRFHPSSIKEWCDPYVRKDPSVGRTALCPKCGIDAVVVWDIKDESFKEKLKSMRDYWFD